MVTLNEQIFDDEQGKLVTVNDLSKGVYDVVCDVGEAFQNRQDHTVKAITQIAAIDPSIIGQGADILLNNISAPGIDILAERKRDMMVKQGLIPLTQLTDEEKSMLQQMMMMQAQNQQPSAEDKIADAEIGRVEAETADTLSKIEERQNKMAMEERKLILDAQKQQFDQQNAVNQAILNELKMQAETLNTLREAIGANTIVGDTNMGAYIEQAGIVGEAQDVFNSED